MPWRTRESGDCALDLLEKNFRRKLCVFDELARKREISSIDGSAGENPESSLGAVRSPSITRGRCEDQSEPDILALNAHFRDR